MEFIGHLIELEVQQIDWKFHLIKQYFLNGKYHIFCKFDRYHTNDDNLDEINQNKYIK